MVMMVMRLSGKIKKMIRLFEFNFSNITAITITTIIFFPCFIRSHEKNSSNDGNEQ